MKLLLSCTLVLGLAAFAVANSWFLSERCDKEFTTQLSWANPKPKEIEKNKEMYCKIFQDILTCIKTDLNDINVRFSKKNVTERKMKDLTTMAEVVCSFTCGGPTLFISLLALPLAVLLRSMN